jgi:universal stress protein A
MRVLVSCDYSTAGMHVLREAKKFLAPIADVEIHVTSIIDIAIISASGLYDNAEIVKVLEAQAEEVNKWAKTTFEGKEVHFSTEVGYPAEMIVQKAKKLDADLLILGTHGKTGISRILIGSVAENVLRHISCNTLVVSVTHLKNGQNGSH